MMKKANYSIFLFLSYILSPTEAFSLDWTATQDSLHFNAPAICKVESKQAGSVYLHPEKRALLQYPDSWETVALPETRIGWLKYGSRACHIGWHGKQLKVLSNKPFDELQSDVTILGRGLKGENGELSWKDSRAWSDRLKLVGPTVQWNAVIVGKNAHSTLAICREPGRGGLIGTLVVDKNECVIGDDQQERRISYYETLYSGQPKTINANETQQQNQQASWDNVAPVWAAIGAQRNFYSAGVVFPLRTTSSLLGYAANERSTAIVCMTRQGSIVRYGWKDGNDCRFAMDNDEVIVNQDGSTMLAGLQNTKEGYRYEWVDPKAKKFPKAPKGWSAVGQAKAQVCRGVAPYQRDIGIMDRIGTLVSSTKANSTDRQCEVFRLGLFKQLDRYEVLYHVAPDAPTWPLKLRVHEKAMFDHLIPGDELTQGQSLRSTDERYQATLQKDCKFTVIGPSGLVWKAKLKSKLVEDDKDCTLKFRPDGNLVLQNSVGKVWQTYTESRTEENTKKQRALVLSNQGNLFIYSTELGVRYWQSRADSRGTGVYDLDHYGITWRYKTQPGPLHVTGHDSLKGSEDGDDGSLHPCSAVWDGTRYTGKLVRILDDYHRYYTCHIGVSGVEVKIREWTTLEFSALGKKMLGFSTDPDTRLKPIPVSIREWDGVEIWYCIGNYGGGRHPGYMAKQKCHIGYGGKEVILDEGSFSFPVLPGTSRNRGVDESCDIDNPCRRGLTCEAFTFVCNIPGNIGDSCHATRPCRDNLSCNFFRCLPDDISTSEGACSAFKVDAFSDLAEESTLTHSYGNGSSVSAGHAAAAEYGTVYGPDNEFGCYVSYCWGGNTDLSISSYAAVGYYARYSDFAGESIVTTQGVSIPFVEAGYNSAQVLSTDGDILGTTASISIGFGLIPAQAGAMTCKTNVVDGNTTMEKLRQIGSKLEQDNKQ